MPRLLGAGLDEAIQRRSRFQSYSTLELVIDTGAELRAYYLATASLDFSGIAWRPELRDGGEVDASLGAEQSEATIQIQNVNRLFGVELVALEEFLSGAAARVGEYFRDLERGMEWHEILMTGMVTGLNPDEQHALLTIIPDTDSRVSVGPWRALRRLCQWEYKGRECGRPPTDPPRCDKTLNGDGGCEGRWGATEKVTHHGGAPYLKNDVLQKII